MKNNQTNREAIRIAVANEYEENQDLTSTEVRDILGDAYDIASEAGSYRECMFGRRECTVRVMLFKTE